MPINNKEVGERLKTFRKKYISTSGHIAGPELGVTQSALSKMESGTLQINTDVIVNLVEKYHANVNWLFWSKGPETTQKVEEVERLTKLEAIEEIKRLKKELQKG